MHTFMRLTVMAIAMINWVNIPLHNWYVDENSYLGDRL